MHAVNDNGISPGGDISGWLGDLFTFYRDWRAAVGAAPSNVPAVAGYSFCQSNLGKADVLSSFKLLDFIEDTDGYNIAMILRNDTSARIYR